MGEISNVVLKKIFMHNNPFDELTKPLGAQLHSYHTYSLLGKWPPSYAAT